jgi:hypothetical protein
MDVAAGVVAIAIDAAEARPVAVAIGVVASKSVWICICTSVRPADTHSRDARRGVLISAFAPARTAVVDVVHQIYAARIAERHGARICWHVGSGVGRDHVWQINATMADARSSDAAPVATHSVVADRDAFTSIRPTGVAFWRGTARDEDDQDGSTQKRDSHCHMMRTSAERRKAFEMPNRNQQIAVRA